MDHAWVRVSTKAEGGAEEFYFMNTETRKTSWERPDGIEGEIPIYGRRYSSNNSKDSDNEGDASREKEKEDETPTTRADEWWTVHTNGGEVYYMHRKSRKTTWEKPCEGDDATTGSRFVPRCDDGAIRAASLRSAKLRLVCLQPLASLNF